MRHGLVALLLVLVAAVSAPPPAIAQDVRIVAVVNGDAITSGDVRGRARLFAFNIGQPVAATTLPRGSMPGPRRHGVKAHRRNEACRASRN